MAKNEWMKELTKIEGAVVKRHNPHERVIQTPSPTVNFIFSRGWGLPYGYSAVLYGPPKGGKSVLCNAMIGQLHQDDPEAIAIKFNTEMREAGQLTDFKMYGIDEERYQAYDKNDAVEVFDDIQTKIKDMCQRGAPIRLIVIDSLTQLEGRISSGMDSVGDIVVGDDARTQGVGLKRILPVIRKYNISLLMTSHIRAEMDQQKVRMTHKNFRMAAAYAVQHFAEYFISVTPIEGAAGRTDSLKNEFIDPNTLDASGNADKLAHKIRVRMEASSVGPAGRTGIFTLDYNRGIINTHEEVFMLGVNRGVITKPNNMSYVYRENKWVGVKSILTALEKNKELCNEILRDVRMKDADPKLALIEPAPKENTLEDEMKLSGEA